LHEGHTFLTGVYLAVNAIKDSYLVVDGPDCIYKKVELIEKNHDYYSRILEPDGKHRICSSMVNVDSVVHDRTDKLQRLMQKIAADDKSGVVLVTSMPMAALTGYQYDSIARGIDIDKPIIDVSYESTGYVEGYSIVLERLADSIVIKDERKKGKIGIVGYLYDRNEGDHDGNIKEIKRLLEKMGLELVSAWLSGSDYCGLERIQEADLIISLPYGREAAKKISSKTGAKVIELGLPFGISNTKEWLMRIAEATGRKEKTRKLIEAEIGSLGIMEWIVPEFFQGRKIGLGIEPHLAEYVKTAFEELDMEVITLSNGEKTDYTITTSDTKVLGGIEIGFPSYRDHFFYTAPFFGFRGFLVVLNRLLT